MRARGVTRGVLVLGLAVALSLSAGCTRRFYRRSTDRQVGELLDEKDVYPPWRIDQWHVYPDCRARFADPSNPDRPPKPYDDPAAEALSPNPQKPGKAGVGGYEGLGYLQLM